MRAADDVKPSRLARSSARSVVRGRGAAARRDRHHGRRISLSLVLLSLIPVACDVRCGSREDTCEDDKDCPLGRACQIDFEGFCSPDESRCVAVTLCASDAECPPGVQCLERLEERALHPFERTITPHGICGCEGMGECRPFGATSTSTSTSTSASVASGGGFEPGTTVTVGPATATSGPAATVTVIAGGGEGGHGGQGGAGGRGGAGGQGGAGGGLP